MWNATKIALIVVAGAVAATPLPRPLVERLYSRGFYPLLQPRLTLAGNGTPFALVDIAGVIILSALALMWITRLRRPSRGLLPTLGGLMMNTLAGAAMIYLWFLLAWGLNYQRVPLRASLDFHEDRISTEALRDLAARNVAFLNTRYADAHRAPWPELEDTPAVLGPAFSRAQRELGMTWEAAGGRPKRSLLNFYFTRVAIDGMTDPLFLEALANQSLLPYERPFVVAHEWAHLAGYADESEANFVGWLICMRGPQGARYSAWLSLYSTIINALPREEREKYARDLQPGPRDDLRAMAERIQRQRVPSVSRAGYAMYDRFLKANRVESGIDSYSEVLRLLLGTRFHEDGSPVLRPDR
jgi:hypothetical protein